MADGSQLPGGHYFANVSAPISTALTLIFLG